MFENIDIDSAVPVYDQIEKQVQFGIAAGRLKAGDQLPRVREMAERLGVHQNTVMKAYRDLSVMGYLYPRRGMGYFVVKGIEARCQLKCWESVVSRIHEVTAEAKAAGFTRKETEVVIKASYSSGSSPYAPVPPEILKLAKKSVN